MRRTDLAEEAHSLWEKSAGKTTRLPGVKARAWEKDGVGCHRVEILDAQGEQALGKPRGVYLTLHVHSDGQPDPAEAEALGRSLTELLHLEPRHSVLVVGLGNQRMTPDAIGPLTLQGLLVTRHLRQQLPAYFSGVRPVSALAPGVLGLTGIESAEIVRSVVADTRPDRVVVVDALAAGEEERLCSAIQVTDAGIVPGSGVGNSRKMFSQKTLGVPVVAVGAPTVMDMGSGQPLLVTPRDIDARVRRLSSLISAGINACLFPDWSAEEIAQFVD